MKLNVILFVTLLSYTALSQDYLPSDTTYVIHKSYYSLSYSESDEIAEWVAYKLDSTMLMQKAYRSSKYYQDPDVYTGTAENLDYYLSGYDRGHLVPARDMQFNELAQYDASSYANITPQHASFNRGIWKRLENWVRWRAEDEMLYISAGPVLYGSTMKIGSNNVTVPEYFYKVIYSPKNNESIGFLIPNIAGTSSNIFDYAVSVDYIENLVGIDFFVKHNNNEITYNIKYWE